MDAGTIARALGGRKAGRSWIARCPAHDDQHPSLSIREGRDEKTLVHCHAGCAQTAVVAALRSRGLWNGSDRLQVAAEVRAWERNPAGPDAARRTAGALAVWQSAMAADGTPVEVYLASRGLSLSPPNTLRFHPMLKHPSGGTWPSIVALVTRGLDGVPLAIHRTYLARDGVSKAAVEPQKMMLGPCRGGAVRLGAGGGTLMIGEGIETTLAVMQVTGRPGWAALSTSGLRSLELPDAIKDVLILADADPPGEAAARATASRWLQEGRRARIAWPPRGMDFNDVLVGRGASIKDTTP